MADPTFTAVDLSRLVSPDILETLDYETLLAEAVAVFTAEMAAIGVTFENRESDPATKLLQTFAYLAQLLRQRVNDAARAVMPAHAVKGDLDNIAALFGIMRQTITAADEALGIAAVMESDDEFRRRMVLAPEGYSVAGPEGAYVFHALSAAADVLDATHLTAYDTSTDVWDASGLGLWLADGTLFAVYADDEPFMAKSGLAFALLAFDIAFNADLSGNIDFGDAAFAYPPATEETRGVARIATQARVDAVADGEDDAETIVTPKTLRARLAAFATAVNASLVAIGETITALTARTITGAGLVTGGGSLAANRVLTVTEASAADITAGTAADKVVTPRRLGPIAMTLAQNGFIRFFGFQIVWGRATVSANSTGAVSFVEEFPTACFACVASGTNDTAVDSKDNWPAVNPATITQAGFSVISADDASQTFSYIAVGH